jgi:hypothetical protein
MLYGQHRADAGGDENDGEQRADDGADPDQECFHGNAPSFEPPTGAVRMPI